MLLCLGPWLLGTTAPFGLSGLQPILFRDDPSWEHPHHTITFDGVLSGCGVLSNTGCAVSDGKLAASPAGALGCPCVRSPAFSTVTTMCLGVDLWLTLRGVELSRRVGMPSIQVEVSCPSAFVLL